MIQLSIFETLMKSIMTTTATFNSISSVPMQLREASRTITAKLKGLSYAQSSSQRSSVATLYFLNDLNYEATELLSTIDRSLRDRSIVSQFRASSNLRTQLLALISKCALLEMKNSSLKERSHQLKQELLRLNTLQMQWFNSACFKN